MAWKRSLLKGNKVYARVREDGSLEADGKGRVEIKYKLEDPRSYSASAANVRPIEGSAIEESPGPGPAPGSSAGDPIILYTDGACSGNPGPMGIGVVLMSGPHRKEISEYLGTGTNNIAELTAIEHGLLAIKDRNRPVLVHSDSAYAIGLLSRAWKAKANAELVERIRALLRTFAHVRFVKVEGHSGVPENERCDELAREAITNRS